MISVTEESQGSLLRSRGRSPQDDVLAQVHRVLIALNPTWRTKERRSESRYPFPHLVRLTPVAEDGITPDGESIVVVGKNLSRRGLDFYHPEPISYRRMIASLEMGGGRSVSFLIDLNWCRFTDQGWYESGGRFLQAIPSDVDG
ncbi:MAG: hypothetical protein A2V70_02165 [Planctomycetes bacterium RBG_13_63_9]|nr:MAG: hypothetical protein A2V70_02165 [Planctomycetes bacterium RBG_13_63_9]